MKRMFAVLCAALLLTGCSDSGNTAASPDLPLPTPAPAPAISVLGEQAEGAVRDVALHYLSADGAGPVQVMHTIYVEDAAALAEQAVVTLLESPGGGLISPAPEGTQLLGLERSGTHATVNLSVDALGVQGDLQRLQLVCSISNTLLGLDGIRSVSVLVGGAAMEAAGLPLGALTAPVESVSGMLAELEAERERALSGASAAAERRAVVYRRADGRYLPEIATVSFGPEPGLEVLADALSEGEGAVFSSSAAVVQPSVCYVSASGMRVLKISLSTDFIAPGLTADDAVAAVILTATTFFPDVDGVSVRLNGAAMTACTVDGVTLLPEGGLFRREQFTRFLGGEAALCFAGSDGLHTVRRIMSPRAALSPRLVLEQLLNGPLDGEGRSPFPEGVSAVDLLGVKLDTGVATVNLSAGFYGRCQGMTQREEQICVYAIVNTLTALEGVSGVRILIEGAAVEDLAGSVSISSVLIENPGIFGDAP